MFLCKELSNGTSTFVLAVTPCAFIPRVSRISFPSFRDMGFTAPTAHPYPSDPWPAPPLRTLILGQALSEIGGQQYPLLGLTRMEFDTGPPALAFEMMICIDCTDTDDSTALPRAQLNHGLQVFVQLSFFSYHKYSSSAYPQTCGRGHAILSFNSHLAMDSSTPPPNFFDKRPLVNYPSTIYGVCITLMVCF